jgi:uncharacterized protein YbaR (Trm112 family)
MMTLDPDFVAMLGCPLNEDRPPLRQDGDYLICDVCAKAFPIVNGIPHLLPENAIELKEMKP